MTSRWRMHRRWLVAAAATLAVCLSPAPARAHCDGLDGPVVKAAQRALDLGDAAFVLMWVPEKDAPEIEAAFGRTLRVRRLGGEARALADTYFFETVVRVHRAAEGAPYTGLKPAGRDLGPAIPAADHALEAGSLDALLRLITTAVESGLRQHFEAAMHAKADARPGDVAAGRRYVAAYVPFIHFVERLYEATRAAAHGHMSDAGHPAPVRR